MRLVAEAARRCTRTSLNETADLPLVCRHPDRSEVAEATDSTGGTGARRTTALVLGLYALVGGLVSFIGWPANIPGLTDWFGLGISIQPNTAVATFSAGASLWLFVMGHDRASRVFAALVAFIGGTALVQYILDVDFGGLNSFLMFGREWGRATTVSPGRMGPPGSISWTLLGTALLLGNRARSVVPRLALVTLDGEIDRRALGVLERVADQIAEHLQHAVTVG